MPSLLFFNNMVRGASQLIFHVTIGFWSQTNAFAIFFYTILLYFCKVIKDSSPYIGGNFDMVFEKKLPFLFYFMINGREGN